jgi:tight adherence protein C
MSALLISACIAVAVFTATALIMVAIVGNQSVAQARLAEVASGPGEEANFGFRDILSSITQVIKPLRGILRLQEDEDLIYRLSVAGYRQPGDADTFLNAKLLCPVLGVLAATFTGSSNVLICSLIFGALGYFAPDLFLLRATSKRKKAIGLSMPNALDLLVVCMEAGLGMDQAVIRVAKELEVTSPELSEEMQILCREQRAGKPRVDAWRSMSERVDLDSVRQFSSMLAQSERLGTPIARALGQFSETLRTKRIFDAEERAAKTTVKLIFPLVCFIFPAMFIVILGPAGIALADIFGEMGH